MSRVLDWNGKDLPDELRRLPAGRYILEELDAGAELSSDEEDGLRKAMASIRAGRGVSSAAARKLVIVPSKRR